MYQVTSEHVSPRHCTEDRDQTKDIYERAPRQTEEAAGDPQRQCQSSARAKEEEEEEEVLSPESVERIGHDASDELDHDELGELFVDGEGGPLRDPAPVRDVQCFTEQCEYCQVPQEETCSSSPY